MNVQATCPKVAHQTGVGPEMLNPQLLGQIYIYTHAHVHFLLQQNHILFTRLGLLPAGECI